jgi:hypothetical protein
MASRRTPRASDRETISALVAVLAPLARRIASDKELRDDLRAAAESLTGAYRKTRAPQGGRQVRADGSVFAYEEPAAAGEAPEPVDAELLDESGRPVVTRKPPSTAKYGATAAAGAAAAVAALVVRKRLKGRGK